MLTCTIPGISWENLLRPETNTFTSNPYYRQTTWPKWMKFCHKKCQKVVFKIRPISNTWFLASVSKSLTESDNSAGWPGIMKRCQFLVVDTRLYTLPRWLIHRSIAPVNILNCKRFSHYCSCPSIRDWIAVCPALFLNFLSYRLWKCLCIFLSSTST